MVFNEKLLEALRFLDFNIDSRSLNDFELFYNELIVYNEKVNLTAIVEEDDFIYKHIIDSLVPLKYISNYTKVLDIGAGAGFPSVPLKIVNKNLNFTCFDSVNKKISWLNYIAKQLKFSNFDAIHGRCEDLAFKDVYREEFDCVVARGVAELSTLLEYCVPFVKVGGVVVAYKANNYKNELNSAENSIKLLNVKFIDIISFKNEKLGERNILIFKKLGKTPLKYPRNQNKPRLKPL